MSRRQASSPSCHQSAAGHFSSYDPAGRLISRTDPNGGSYGFTYDQMGRMTSETDPLGGSIQFSYDAAGQRTGFTNPNGAGRSWSYDNGGRVTSHADELGRITSYSYDTGGRLIGFNDVTGSTTMSWDPMGRITAVTSTAGTVGYSYNAAGEQVSMTQPEGAIGLQWHAAVSQTAYNLDVADLDTYYVLAGDTPVLVHNHDHDGRFDGPKPEYEINPQHVPTHPDYNREKTPLPADAEDVYRNAVPDDPTNARHWFGINEDGEIYKFHNSNNGKAHFSLVVDENHPVVAQNRYLRDRLDELRGRRNGNPGGCP